METSEDPMRIEAEIKLDYKDVLLRPKRSSLKSRAEIELNRKFTFCHSDKTWEGIPIIAANMDHTGTFRIATELAKNGMMGAISKFHDVESWKKFHNKHPEVINNCFVSAGLVENDFNTLNAVMKDIPCPFICLDVANGYTESFVEYVSRVREAFPDHIIMAGNVVTGEMTEQLILSGADIVKVGIGPGSVCTTRHKTGIGYPQLSAVIECADAAHGLHGHVCADGGCTKPGDVAKAFAAGADFVMLGGMLAGHDESEGEIVEKDGKKFKEFYGMSSRDAMHKHKGTVADYRASEGKTVLVPYRGPLQTTVQEILGGVRSTCTYVGAVNLKALPKCATFIRVTSQANEIFT